MSEPTGAVTIADTESEKPKLQSLSNIEKVVNEYARVLAVKHRINPDHFSVHLVTELSRGDMEVVPGQVVQIILLWPDTQPIINMKLTSAFRLMMRYQMRRTLELVPVAYVAQAGVEFRKFAKQKLGDIGEVLPDLITRHRLRLQVSTVFTLTDNITKESVTMTSKGKVERFDGNQIGMWLELSRIVKDKHPLELVQDQDDVIAPIAKTLSEDEIVSEAIMEIEQAEVDAQTPEAEEM